MNKIYKLVYSKTLNQIVAVSEIANSDTKGTIAGQPRVKTTLFGFGQKLVNPKLAFALALSGLFTALPMGVAQANTNKDKSSNQNSDNPALNQNELLDATLNPTLNYKSSVGYNAQNPGVVGDASYASSNVHYQQNVPVVNIQNPNNVGVSDNRFAKLSTDTGIVFNNNADKTIELKARVLAQKIKANPNLKRAATTILAQVTGNDRTVIKGVMEILGKRADLIVINPNGIDLNGVQLVNTHDFTASTAEVNANNAHRLNVSRGTINVNNDLSNDEVNMIRLIAKAVKIKATIAPTSKAKSKHKADIIVSAGSQSYNLDNDTTRATQTSSNDNQNVVAIRGDALGSMYGNKVNFIVTDSGAGVEYNGLIVGDDNLSITADGNVRIGNTMFSEKSATVTSKHGKVSLESHNPRVATAIKAKHEVKVVGKAVDTTKGVIHATKKIEVAATGADLNVGDVIATKVKLASATKVHSQVGSQILANHADVYGANDLLLDGKVFVNDQLDLTTGQSLTNNGSDSSYAMLHQDSKQQLTSTATDTSIHLGGAVIVAGNTNIEADRIEYTGSAIGTVDPNDLSTTSAHDFTFNNISLKFDLDKVNSGVYLNNGTFATNDLTLDYHTNQPGFPTKPLLNINNGRFAVFQNTHLDLSRGGERLDLTTQRQFDRLNALLTLLNSNSAMIEASSINIAKDTDIKLTRNSSFKVDSYHNAGSLTVDGSLGIITQNHIDNPGLLYVAGDLLFNSATGIDLDGKAYVYRDAIINTPVLNQTGVLHVKEDLDLTTSAYNLVAHTGGKVALAQGNHTESETWSYHDLRKDKYTISMNSTAIDTSDVYTSPAETIVGGNFSLNDYQANPNHNFDSEEVAITDSVETDTSTATDNNSSTANTHNVSTQTDGVQTDDSLIDSGIKNLLHIKNSRLYVGGNIQVDGDIKVESTAYNIPAMEFLRYDAPLTFTYSPRSLFNSKLWATKTKTFANLYDFLDTMLSGNTTAAFGYNFDDESIFNTLIMNRNLDPIVRKMLSSVLEADWQSVNLSILKQRWDNFKTHPQDYKITVFAPKAEVFAGQSILQRNGELYVGANVTAEHRAKTIRNYWALGQAINIYSSVDGVIQQKISGLQPTSNYLLTLKDLLIKHRDQTVSLKRSGIPGLKSKDYRGIGALNIFDERQNIGDDGALALIVLEQMKDLGGASLATDARVRDVFTNLMSDAHAYNKASLTLNMHDNPTGGKVWSVVDANGVKHDFETATQARTWLNQAYNHIDWGQDEHLGDKYVPKLRLTDNTLAKLTNFNKVAASLTAVETVTSMNADDINVNFGSINSKSVQLQSFGDVKFASMAGQFAVNSNNSQILSSRDFYLLGNADFGDLNLISEGDTTFHALTYITDRGDVANQGIIKANNAKISTDHLVFDASKLFSENNISIVAHDIEMKAEYNDASYFNSISRAKAWSGREVNQIGQFVTGAKLIARNDIDVHAQGNLSLESSAIVSGHNTTINVDNNLTTSAKNDVKYMEGYEYKTSMSITAKAQFGSLVSFAETTFTPSYLEDGQLQQSTVMVDNQSSDPTPYGASLGSVSAGVSVDSNIYKHIESLAHNNNLDATNLTVNVGNHAELGNTNINALGNGVNANNQIKTADIKAGAITQHQAISEQHVSINNVGWGLSASTYVTSSIADVASHVTSVARASLMNQSISPAYAVTAIGDLAGLATTDALNVGAKVSFGYHKNKARLKQEFDSTNKVAGDLAITTTGDTELKAIDGSSLNEVHIQADNFKLEGIRSQTNKKVQSHNVDFSIGVAAGGGLTGAAATMTGTLGGEASYGVETTSTYTNSIISAKNVTINADKDVVLKSANINANKNLNVSADQVYIESRNDVYEARKSGFQGSVTAGTTISTHPVPFGQVSVGVNHHVEVKETPSALSGLTSGDQLHVKAGDIGMVSGIIAANQGKVEADHISVKNLIANEVIDGGGASVSFGINRNKSIVSTIRGQEDTNRHYKAVLKSTVNDKLDLTAEYQANQDSAVLKQHSPTINVDADRPDDFKPFLPVQVQFASSHKPHGATKVENTGSIDASTQTVTSDFVNQNSTDTAQSVAVANVNGASQQVHAPVHSYFKLKHRKPVEVYDEEHGATNLNHNLDQITDVRISKDYQGTPFSFSFSTTVNEDIKNTLSGIKEYMDSYSVTQKLDNLITIGAEPTINPNQNQNLTPNQNPNPNPNGKQHITDMIAANDNVGLNPTSLNDYDNSAYSGNSDRIWINNQSVASNNDPTPIRINADVDDNGFSSYVQTVIKGNKQPDQTQNSYITDDDQDKDKATGSHGSLLQQAQEIKKVAEPIKNLNSNNNKYFEYTKLHNNHKAVSTDVTFDFENANGKAPVSAVGKNVDSFDQVHKMFDEETSTNSNYLIHYRPITQQFGSVFRERKLEFDLNNPDTTDQLQDIDLSSLGENITSGGNSNLPGDSSGSNLDIAGSIGGINPSIDTNPAGGNPTANPSLPDIDTSIDTRSKLDPNVGIDTDNNDNAVVPDLDGTRPSRKPADKLDIPKIDVPDATRPDINTDIGGVEVEKPPVTPRPPFVPDIPHITEPQPEVPDYVPPGLPEIIIPGATTDDTDTVVNPDDVVSTPDTMDPTDTIVKDKDTPPTTVEKPQEDKKTSEKEETPGDGNAENGDEIPLGKNHSLKKLVFDDLTCYVLQKSKVKDISYSENDFDNFLARNHLKPQRATLFSTYSNALISTLGDSGVICMASNSEILKTDFQLVSSHNDDYDQTKGYASNKILPQKLDVIVVLKHKALPTALVANDEFPTVDNLNATTVAAKGKKASKVGFASFTPKAAPEVEVAVLPENSRIVEIQNKLANQGIDPDKLLILGTKSSTSTLQPKPFDFLTKKAETKLPLEDIDPTIPSSKSFSKAIMERKSQNNNNF